MITTGWYRLTSALRDRCRTGALAQYGAGLHDGCDCPTAPHDLGVPLAVPAPRRATGTHSRAAAGPVRGPMGLAATAG